MNRAIVGLGSNIDPARHIGLAVERIGQQHRVLTRSALLITTPIGPQDQPHYLNGAVLIETALELEDLRAWLKELERDLGRRPTAEKYGPRTIDLDVVVWNDQIIHQDVHEREFLRRSVLEVAPQLELE